MKIAVTYKDGKIYEHFGHTEQFKIYDVEDGKIMSAKVIDTDGNGHEALASYIKEQGVEVLICGGMGQGAADALNEAGIRTVTGTKGYADEVVEAYLAGDLTSEGVNCHHHNEEEEEEGCGGCGGGCGGCGGCHSMEPQFEGKNVGKICKVHYRGTFNDGTQFDSSYDRGEPLQFVCGAGMMIKGFDMAVANMEVGDKVNVHLEPSEAYGETDPDAIFTVELSELPGAEKLNVGERAYLTNTYGQQFVVLVTAKDDKSITFDANHEMAGKELNFEIELVSVQ